jgi:hypothetical protein
MTSKAQGIGPVPNAMQRPKQSAMSSGSSGKPAAIAAMSLSISFHCSLIPEPNLSGRVGTKAIAVHPH